VLALMRLLTALSTPQHNMLDKLRGLHGADFDGQHVSDHASGDKDALSLSQRCSNGGDNQNLKAWAGTTLPILRQHLDMTQKLNK
jgi:putative membrane protein